LRRPSNHKDIIMKRPLALIASTLLVLTTTVALATPSGASAPACSVAWGSLAKEVSAAPATTDLGDVVGVRSGRHACYDRIVIDLDGAAAGYRVDYVPELVQDGSGRHVAVDGGAILQIVAKAPAYDDEGHATLGRRAVNRMDVSGYRTFRDVAFAGSFEGQTNIGVGVRARLPFRVFALAGPGNGSRIVVDVAHRW
jgi:hypothetical protein